MNVYVIGSTVTVQNYISLASMVLIISTPFYLLQSLVAVSLLFRKHLALNYQQLCEERTYSFVYFSGERISNAKRAAKSKQ